MRTIATLLVLSVFLASCAKTYESATQYPYDEVYNPDGKMRDKPSNQVSSASSDEGMVESHGDYAGEYDARGFEPEDYYDYEYSSRLRRFHQTNPGFGYYDDYYTSYDFYPGGWYMGSNIYSGWGCAPPFGYGMRPGWSLSFNYSYGWGYPGYGYYDPWYNYYDPWYTPFYPYYGYGGYGHGYNNGYYHGFYDGYYASSYRPVYYNNYYYGPRSTIGGSSDGTGRGFRNSGEPSTGELKTKGTTPNTTGGMVASGNQSGNGTGVGKTSGELNGSASRNIKYGSVAVAKVEAPTSADNPSASKLDKPVSAAVYSKPDRMVQQDPVKRSALQNGNPASYELPAQKYQKPKAYSGPMMRTTPSSKEYTSPAAKGSRSYGKPVFTAIPKRQPASESSRSSRFNWRDLPETISRSASNPSSSRSSDSRSYSTPSRSYSSPSVSRSSSSNSSSRSTGSSGASRSGGRK